MFTEFLNFVESIYGGIHVIETSTMGHSILIIENGRDKFKVNLSDKDRFGKYTLYHRDYGKKLDGRWCYHPQIRSRNLSYIIWISYTHDFNKSIGIFDNRENYERFFQDWKNSLKR